MASRGGGGGVKPQDDGLEILRRVRGDLENLSSGTAYWNAGRPAGSGLYPIDYQAKTLPPVFEDIQLATGLLGGNLPSIHVEVTDEDRRIMKQKMDMKDVANLHRRFFETYRPMDDPIRYWTLRQIWPEPFEAMERAIEKRADMQKDIQKKMLGEPTKESLIMLMALQDDGDAQAALQQPIGPKDTQPTTGVNDPELLSGLVSRNQIDYTRGLASVARFFQGGMADNTAATVLPHPGSTFQPGRIVGAPYVVPNATAQQKLARAATNFTTSGRVGFNGVPQGGTSAAGRAALAGAEAAAIVAEPGGSQFVRPF